MPTSTPRPLVIAAAVCVAGLLVALPCAPAAHAAHGPRHAEILPNRYVVVYHDSVDRPAARTDRLERKKGFHARFRYGRALKGFAARLSAGQVAALRRDPGVDFIVHDRLVRASADPLAPGDSAPLGVRRLEAATGSSTRGASGAAVAVIDSGVDLAHPELNVADGRNCVGTGPAQDENGHGTHVAGTIAARNNGSGVVGVAPGTKLYAVKVLDAAGAGSFSQIICGIDWVAGTRADADPSNDIAVANMSLGGTGSPVGTCATTTDPMHAAICRATAAGVTFVVAAGNSGWDFDYAPAPDVPAAYPEVLTVTAMSDSDGRPGGVGGAPTCTTGEGDDRYATFSNFAATSAGAAHAIAAPGVCITSTRRGGGVETMSGTSMAAPHVAGTVALCLNEGSIARSCAGLTPAQVVSRMRADAQAHSAAAAGYGFVGDPLRPFSGASFGYLAWAGVPVADTEAPTIASLVPADTATGVARTATVSVTFSEAMDAAPTQAAFTLARASDGAPVAGTYSWSGTTTLTFRPSAPLGDGVLYTARVSTGAKDSAGNAFAGERSWSFKTLATQTLGPAGATIEAGSLRAGGLSSLAADDGAYLQVASTGSSTRTTSWYGRFAAVPRDLRGLTVTYSGRNSASCSQTVSIWRWSTSSWIQLDGRTVGTTEALVQRAVSGTLTDYVSSTGDVRVRVRCTASAGFTASADQLRLTVSRP